MYKYKVYKIYADNHRELIGETFAVSREKAISNVRYRKTKDIGWGLYGKNESVRFDAVHI